MPCLVGAASRHHWRHHPPIITERNGMIKRCKNLSKSDARGTRPSNCSCCSMSAETQILLPQGPYPPTNLHDREQRTNQLQGHRARSHARLCFSPIPRHLPSRTSHGPTHRTMPCSRHAPCSSATITWPEASPDHKVKTQGGLGARRGTPEIPAELRLDKTRDTNSTPPSY